MFSAYVLVYTRRRVGWTLPVPGGAHGPTPAVIESTTVSCVPRTSSVWACFTSVMGVAAIFVWSLQLTANGPTVETIAGLAVGVALVAVSTAALLAWTRRL